MKIKLKSNLLSGILFMVLSVVVWIIIPYQIKIPQNGTVITDPSFFPKVFTATLFVIGLLLFGVSVVGHKEVPVEFDMARQLNLLEYFGMIILYVILIGVIGYLLSSVLFGIASLAFFHCKKKLYYVILIAAGAAVYFGFVYLLQVPLP